MKFRKYVTLGMDSEKKEKGLFRIFTAILAVWRCLFTTTHWASCRKMSARMIHVGSQRISHTGGRNDYQVSSWQAKALCLRDTKNNIPRICPCELKRDILTKGKTQLIIPSSASREGPSSLPRYVSFLFVLLVVRIKAGKWK